MSPSTSKSHPVGGQTGALALAGEAGYHAAALAVLMRTPLFEGHAALGAKLIDFGGWEMPLHYSSGIIQEHKTVRSSVGCFDVSHMGEAALVGRRARAGLQRVITNDAGKLAPGRALYTVMCNHDGAIVDDCIVYCRSEEDFLIVLNAANTVKDLTWLAEHAGAFADVRDESEATALLAVQGPQSVGLLQGLADANLAAVPRFSFVQCSIAAVPCMAARTGYTGEDGFELACASARAGELWSALLAAGAAPIGLGARDTLRLEARLCLYGNDIDETTSPYEADLGWVVKPEAGDFVGKEALLRQKASGIKRKLIGFKMTGRGIGRPGYPIAARDKSGEGVVIGHVTSGTMGISVGTGIGMGYVARDYAGDGTEIAIDCRGKYVSAIVVKGPFYKR